MKTNDIFRKLYKQFTLKSTRLLIDHKILTNELDFIIKHKDIIRKVIDEYNFKGRNFKVEYLPAILAMAIEEAKKENQKEEEKSKSTTINDILTRAYNLF